MKWLGGNPSIFSFLSILVLCYWTITLVFADTRIAPNTGTDSLTLSGNKSSVVKRESCRSCRSNIVFAPKAPQDA